MDRQPPRIDVGQIRQIVDHCGISGESYRDDLQKWYTPFNAFVSIGPPVRRIEEMIALIEAGVLRVMGPGMEVRPAPDGSAFLVSSSKVPGEPVQVTTLIEARLPEPDIRTTTDPLLGGLLARGECVLHRIPSAGGGYYETGGLAVGPRPYPVLGPGRVPHPRRFAFGVPTETVHWVTAAGIRAAQRTLGFQLEPPAAIRCDNFSFQGARLPYWKFPKNPGG